MDVLPNDVVRNRVREIVEKNLKTTKFSTKIVSGSEKGDNYMGIVYRAKFCADCDGGSCNSCKCRNKLSMIVKLPPENKIRREKFHVRPIFLNEALAYDEVLPAFMRFQGSKGIIPSEGGFHEIAHCYGTITDDGVEAIFMKDLAVEGFQMFDRHNYLPIDHVKMILRILGKYHAISYAMKDQCPEKFKKYKAIKDMFAGREGDAEFEGFMQYVKGRAVQLLDPERHQKYIDRINKLFENTSFLNRMIQLTNGEEAEPYAIVGHGDCWNNNMLYRYEQGKVVDARLVDWQIIRYCSPVCDLMYFIFLATSKEQREKHYSDFMDTYHNTLSSFLKRLGSSPDKLFPRSALNEQLKKFGSFGFLMGCMLIPILTKPADEAPDLDELAESMKDGAPNPETFISTKNEDAYAERMSAIIFDTVDFGYM